MFTFLLVAFLRPPVGCVSSQALFLQSICSVHMLLWLILTDGVPAHRRRCPRLCARVATPVPGDSAASRSRPSGRHAPSYTARLRAAVLAFECLHMQASSTPNLSFRVAVVDGGIEHMPTGDRGGAWGGVERPLF